MKTYTLFVVAFLFSINVYCQKGKVPDFYIDSNKVDFYKTYINTRNVDSVSFSKETEQGAVYVFTNDTKKTFCSLEDILKKHTRYKKIRPTMIFRINNNTIDDIENISIDPTFYVYIDIDQAGQLNYISKKYKDLLIVNISLEEEERKPEIRIRGTAYSVNQSEQKSPVKELLPLDKPL